MARAHGVAPCRDVLETLQVFWTVCPRGGVEGIRTPAGRVKVCCAAVTPRRHGKIVGPPRYLVGGPLDITRKNHTPVPLGRILYLDTDRIGLPHDFAELTGLPGPSGEAAEG